MTSGAIQYGVPFKLCSTLFFNKSNRFDAPVMIHLCTRYKGKTTNDWVRVSLNTINTPNQQSTTQQDVYNKMFTTRCFQQDVYLTKISQFTDTIVVHQYITTFDVTMDNVV
jgi:hypothetical protein